MTALLLFGQFTEPKSFLFGSGLETWATENLPQVQLLDLDSQSAKTYAAQLAEAASQAPVLVLWVKSAEAASPLGALAPVVESWLRHPGPKLLALEGEHAQIQRMGMAGSAPFYKGKNAEELKPEVLRFFSSATAQA